MSVTNSQNALIKKQRLIIWVLSLFIIVVIGFLLWHAFINGDLDFEKDPRPTKDGPKKVDKYRSRLTLRRGVSYGLWYDTAGFRKYLDKFPELIEKAKSEGVRSGRIKIDNYEWKLCFYWMMKKDDEAEGAWKIDYCMVPTLVNKSDPRDVKDYFDSKNDQYYDHSRDKEGDMRKLLDGVIYNEGQLWP